MGKFDKSKKKKEMQPYPLDQQIINDQFPKASTRVKVRNRHEEDVKFVDDKSTKKILLQARQQQEELEEEIGLNRLSSRLETSNIHGHLSREDDDDEEDFPGFTGEDFMEEIKISEEDEKALANFMPKDAKQRATLGEIIKEKLTEKQTELNTIFSDAGSMSPEVLEKISAIYKGVGVLLSRYRSGKLPKPFKAIPKFTNWEQILYITEPDKWSAAAMYQATRIFASNLKDNMAQRFYNLILLPRLRDDIAECKKLNVHLYEALKKAVFKPAAFFRGIILPLCESGTCTLREATIFGSVLAKLSIPILHSSAALLLIAQMEYNGTNSIFMRILIEKKYALPFRVIDAVVSHFCGFMEDHRELPLLWHQCLLTFVETYKNDISIEQQKELMRLLKVHTQRYVTPEIRRELMSSTCRSTAIEVDES